MRIGFVSPFYHPAMIGGIEWYLLHTTRLLAGRGHEVTVYTTDSDGEGGRLPGRDQLEGIRIERFPAPIDLTYRLKVWPGLVGALRRADLEVLHVFDYAQFHNLAVLLSRKRPGWASVVTVYDIHSEIPRSPAKNLPMAAYDRYVAKLALRGYDRVLIRTPYHAEFLRGLGVDEGSIRVTPPGLDPETFQDPPEGEVRKVRDRYAPGAVPIVLYVGRLHQIKGVDVLIKATGRVLAEGHQIRTVIVGPEANGYGRVLRRLAGDLGIEDHVAFTGYIDEREKWFLQSACDLSVLPSSFEGFGQSLIQAMARGKPVIGTTRGAMPWVLENGQAGMLVEYGDERSLASAITTILTDDGLRQQLSRAGVKRAAEFSYPRLVAQLEAIYASIGSRNAK